MNIQLDTNILTRLAQPSHQLHGTALNAVRRLEGRGDTCCIVPQNLYEFWAVATRPIAVNGLALTVAEAASEVAYIRKSFLLHRDPPQLLDEWQQLVIANSCLGKPSHDARIVAAMNVHAIKQILTFNGSDFTRFSGIIILDPEVVTSSVAT
jgi:predicted nucleic acid-binding protein